MVEAVEKRKNKFERFMDLRKTQGTALAIRTEKFTSKEAKRKSDYSIFDRIQDIADDGKFDFFTYSFPSINPLEFPEYEEKKDKLKATLNVSEAIVSGTCYICGRQAVVIIMNKDFLMGSMGIELGETVALGCEYAKDHSLPLIIFTASGGARMQEGILGLMQMAKTAAVIEDFKEAGGLYISVLTHPTTGGVSASFATLGDITLAEPNALIGFAGPRVIEQTINKKLPKGFQRAEFLQEHGFVDAIVSKENMRKVLGRLLLLHAR